jgi:hypothetical protein
MLDRKHNSPPDPLDEAIATDPEALELAEGMLTGSPVENEAQMRATDDLAKRLKAVKKAVEAAEESEAKPIFDEWKATKARFKPTLDDLDRMIKGCASMVSDFKRKLAAEKAEAERKAREEAEAKARAAHEAAQRAADSDIDAQREAAMAQAEAEAAQKAAQQASRANDVKGLRTVTRFEITDHRALLNWIAKNRREDLTAFIEEWARRNHKDNQAADGLRVWQEKRAY